MYVKMGYCNRLFIEFLSVLKLHIYPKINVYLDVIWCQYNILMFLEFKYNYLFIYYVSMVFKKAKNFTESLSGLEH